MIMRAIWTRLAPGIATLALALASGAANADCDVMTGGGFIIVDGAKANFGVAGGCKDGTPTFGHLEYIDHGASPGLNVHWTSITAYVWQGSGTDSKGRPIGSRGICGKARTNLPSPNDNVDFVVLAKDAGEPGVMDEFDIRLVKNGHIVYTTEGPDFPHRLNDGNGGGGNIQLHGPTAGDFSPLNVSTCPANFPGA
jgi:hypothetical protein